MARKYHKLKIKKGKLGESSKILEETLELIDSEKQNSKVMALIELSDLIGAIKFYLKKNYKEIDFKDLIKFSEITERSYD